MKSLLATAILSLILCGSSFADCLKCSGKDVPCAHPDLAQNLEVPVGNWNIFVCYSIYGSDDPGLKHDGTEAWVQTNLGGDQSIIADYALPPGATGTTPRDSTTIARCDIVPVAGPFSFTGTVMTESQSPSLWGCPSPKLGVPSKLTVTVEAK